MSIQSEITRISEAKVDISAAISAKGVEIPAGTKIDGMAALIAAIAGQKPEQSKTVSPALTQQVITPDDGKALSSVTVEAVTKELLSALDESFKAENIKNGASILGLPGTFSPFGANAGISNYLIETFDYTDVGTSGGNTILIRREGLGWIPHVAIHALVGASETGSPIAPNNHAVFAGFVDLRHWCPTYTKVLFYNFSLYNNGSDHAWWLPSVDMLNPANSVYTDNWTENNCGMAQFKPDRYHLFSGTRWLRILLRFNEPTVTLTAPTGLTISDGTNSGDSLTGSSLSMAWNRSTITGGDDCVYLIYRDGALISTRVKDAGFTGNQANITWSSITEADSGTYTVRAYNSYAGLSEPSNAVTFTYQA